MIALYIAAWLLVGILATTWGLYDAAREGEKTIPDGHKWFYAFSLFFGPVLVVLALIVMPFMYIHEKNIPNPFHKYCEKRNEAKRQLTAEDIKPR